MANSTQGAVVGRNFLVPQLHSQMPTEALQDSRHQNLASNDASGIVPFPLGMKMETFDGRVFRYVENGSATAFAEGNSLVQIADVTCTAASTDATGTIITCTAPAATQYLNEHYGSYAYVSVGTGEGVARRIVANSASVASTAGMTITLERSIHLPSAPVTPLSNVTIVIHSPWRVRLCPTGVVAPAVGAGIASNVAGVSFGVISAQTGSGLYVAGGVSYYGWMQTKGLCEKVLVTGAVSAAGLLAGALTGSASVAGSADPAAAAATIDDVRIFAYAAHGTGSYDIAVMANLFCE